MLSVMDNNWSAARVNLDVNDNSCAFVEIVVSICERISAARMPCCIGNWFVECCAVGHHRLNRTDRAARRNDSLY